MGSKGYRQGRKKIVESALARYLPQEEGRPVSRHQAAHYGLFARGKRILPIPSLATFEAAGGKGDTILMANQSSPADGTIIHARQIIVDERVRMDHLSGAGKAHELNSRVH